MLKKGHNALMKKYFFPSYNGVSSFFEGQVTSAIVDKHGNKRVGSEPSKNKIIFWNIFLLRGLQFFIFGLIAQFSAFTFCDNLQVDKEKGKNFFDKMSIKLNIATKYIQIFTCVILAFIFSFFVFDLLPSRLSLYIVDEFSDIHLRGLIVGLIRMIIVYLVFLFLRFMPFMQGLYRLNGACNQVVNCNEKITELRKTSHHYALNYLNFIVFALMLSSFVVSLVAISESVYLNIIYNFLIVIGCIMVGYELLWAIAVTKSKWLKDFVLLTSPLVAIKPSLTEEEIVRTALIENSNDVKGLDKVEDDKVPMSAVISQMQTKLISADRYEKSDLEWIIATVLNKNRAEIKLIRSITKKEEREILRATDRRAKGEPLSNIFGFVDFYGLRFDVNKKVLSPRMETELLVEEVIKLASPMKNPTICDLCTGSGAIAVSLAKNCDAKITAIDVSKSALQVAEQNAKKHDVKIDFIESDIFAGIKKHKKFDIIVSNPPYIETKEIAKLSIEVKKYDPKLALDGGADGLEFYRRIVKEAPLHLEKEGQLIFEVGKGQAKAVRELLKDAGFIDTRVIKDYNNIERIVYGKYSK